MSEPEYILVQPGLDGVVWLGEVIDGEPTPIGKIADLLGRAPEPVGVELTEGEREALLPYLRKGVGAFAAVERIIAARQAPTALDREAVAEHFWNAAEQGGSDCEYWEEACPSCRERFLGHADAVLALPGVTQAPIHAVMGLSAKDDGSPELYCLCDTVPCQTLEALAPTVGLDFDTMYAVMDSHAQAYGGVSKQCRLIRSLQAADPRRTEASVKAEALREGRLMELQRALLQVVDGAWSRMGEAHVIARICARVGEVERIGGEG